MSDEQPRPDAEGGSAYDHIFRDSASEPTGPRPRLSADELTDDTLYRQSQRHAAPMDAAAATGSPYSPRRGFIADTDPDATVLRPRVEAPTPAASHTAPPAPAAAASLTAPIAQQPAPTETGDEPLFADFSADEEDPVVDAPEPATTGRHATARPGRHPFTQSLGWTALSALVPGLGLVKTKARWLGVLTALTFVAAVVGGGLWARTHIGDAASLAVRPRMLKLVSIGAATLGVVWVLLILGTHLLTRPRRRTPAQRAVGALVVGGLSFVVAAPLAVAARYSSVQSGLINDVFKTEDQTKSQTRPTLGKGPAKDVWADKPRLNILLVGTDNTAVRNEDEVDVNTDTMMVASIDTATGNTVIIQIPRNMARTPFPKGSELAKRYPYGFYDGQDADNSDYFANAIWGHVPAEHPDLFANTDYKGADALKLGMEGITGLKIDYFVALNIDGLVKLIDAMGGVRINVNVRIPVAGRSDGSKKPDGYIEPGPNQLLNGYYAMWYARSRSDSNDYVRMGRQTCVVKGVIDQADPATMLTRYEDIARASADMISTDIPQSALPPIVELATRVKNAAQTRVLFVHKKDGFNTTNPDFPAMQARIKKAIDTVGQATKGAPPTTAKPKPSTSTTSKAPTAVPTVSASSGAESLTDACAYQPQ